jgi:hypothetical protein
MKTSIFRAILMEVSFIYIAVYEDVCFTLPATCECCMKKPQANFKVL